MSGKGMERLKQEERREYIKSASTKELIRKEQPIELGRCVIDLTGANNVFISKYGPAY